MITDIFRRDKPPGALVCTVCVGRGFRKARCTTCHGVGFMHPNEARYYACKDCDNARCRKCGGDGIPINPPSVA